MTGAAYYNENDPYAAEWLRRLSLVGLIAPGDVEERSITDVNPDDLSGFTHVHFFAGIGGWAFALRLAGWPDDRPVWTGSCPCQPFSAAGKRQGTDDERHLWPEFRRLITECRPPVVFGEQVASKDGRAWLAVVRTDMEALGYAVAAADLCAAGVGAPHIRQRLWFVADAMHAGRAERRPGTGSGPAAGSGGLGVLADADGDGWEPREPAAPAARHRGPAVADGGAGMLADAGREGLEIQCQQLAWPERAAAERSGAAGRLGHADRAERPARDVQCVRAGARFERAAQPSAYDPWTDVEWLPCRDGKFRPTKPGIFPMAHGVPGRVGQLRGYGNAIVPQVAAEFIKAFLAVRP